MSYDSSPRFNQLREAMRGRVVWEIDPSRLARIMAPDQVESADRMWLHEIVAERGDPRLTAWEEGFLATIARMLHTPQWWPSSRQAVILRQIDERLRGPRMVEEEGE